MSDSIMGLSSVGTDTIFRIEPDWTTRPEMDFQFGREVVQYDKAVLKYRNLTTDIGWKVSMGFLNYTKADEKALYDFFVTTAEGMAKKFWLPVRFNYFKLAKKIKNHDTTFENIDDGYQYAAGHDEEGNYYDRIFIFTRDGSLITRSVTDVDGITVTVADAFDRDIPLSEVNIFGKLILCRFDQDEIELRHTTRDISETTLSFLELAKEYIPT